MQTHKSRVVEVIDDGLVNHSGHHYNYCAALSKNLTRYDLRVRVWSHSQFKGGNHELLDHIPFLSHYCYDVANASDEYTLQRSALEYRTIFQIGREHEVIFFPNFRLHNCLAIQKLFEIGIDVNSNLLILLRYSEDLLDSNGEFFLSRVKQLCECSKRVKIVADTKRLCELLVSRGVQAELMGMPVLLDESCHSKEDKFDFTFMGSANPLKGFFNILSAVSIGNQVGFSPRIGCQSTNLPISTLTQFKAHPYLKNITWIEPNLTASQFIDKISESSFILLPYDTNAFSYNSSGILLEALLLRKFVLTTKTAFSSELMNDLDETVFLPNNNPDTIFARMKESYEQAYFPKTWMKAWANAAARASPDAISRHFL
jgi:hypothetical protein